ncbi:MAG: hypothetical protein ACKO4Q_02925 [Planctomycetota bacterium]
MKRELRAPLLCATAPLALFVVLCSLARPEPLSPLAPLLGPFAGELYGHRDCTLARVATEWSTIAAIVLAVAVLTSWRAHAHRRATLRVASYALLALACVQWYALAALSVLNTLS